MNEYIILHDGLDREIKRLIKVSTILSWKPHKLGTGHVASVLNFKPKDNKIDYFWRIHESPAEIEALIMGYNLPEFDEVDDSCKNEPASSFREINALKDDMEKLKEENAKLKAKNAVLQSANDFIKSLQEVNPFTVSSPQNRCCRETFNKLNEYYHGMNMKVVCHNQQEVHERGQLECWRQSFKDKIEENKND